MHKNHSTTTDGRPERPTGVGIRPKPKHNHVTATPVVEKYRFFAETLSMHFMAVLSPMLPVRSLSTLAIALLFSLVTHAAGPTGLLNDTAQTQCDNGSNVLMDCSNANTGNAAVQPRQDGRFGRDIAGSSKIGGGAGGFDFSRVCFNGDVQGTGSCTGTLVANTTASATGSPSTDWACTKDNTTNLIWSLQTGQGDWTTYAQTTLPNDANTQKRCGFSNDWRLPNRRELLSIVHNGLATAPMIDSDYFPATVSGRYWTSDVFAPLTSYAWFVLFAYGDPYAGAKTLSFYVRLVRSGP